MSRQSSWTNPDGLVVGYGPHSSDNDVPAVTSNETAVKVMTVMITGKALEASASLTAASLHPNAAVIKRGSIIQRAKFETVVPFAGASSTLNIGTYKAGVIGTVDVAAGIDATVAIAAMDAIGEIVVCDGTLVNGVIPCGATSDSDVEIVAGYGTAPFTAGVGILTVEYIEPMYNRAINA